MKLFKIILTFIHLFISILFVNAQIKSIEFKDLDSLQQLQPKPTILFIHTDWCKYCLAMQQSTFRNKEIVEIIQNKFYFITLNAEEKSEIIFNNNPYNFQQNGINTGVHDLAKFLGNKKGEIIYPTICILNHSNQIIFQVQGYISSRQMIYLLKKFQTK